MLKYIKENVGFSASFEGFDKYIKAQLNEVKS